MADKQAFQVDRIAFFSDAVLAIAITLMIIEVKPPHLHHADTAQALGELLKLSPMFIGVVMSFAFIGVFWFRHHHLFKYITNYTTKLIIYNMIFLGAIIFIPFSTAFNFENTGVHTGLPLLVYNLNYLVASIASLLLFRYALNPKNGVCTDEGNKELKALMPELEFPIIVFAFVGISAMYMIGVAPALYALFGLQGVYSKWRMKKT